MDIVILGHKFRLEILILIVIVFWILFGHLLCSCSHVSAREAFTAVKKVVAPKKAARAPAKKVPVAHSTTGGKKEGFVGANTNYGESSRYSLAHNNPVNTSSWSMPDLTYSKGSKKSKGLQNILNRKPQPVPLPKGELDMFATTPFKPECCPNTYSNSMGCACMTVNQYDYLINRGGNNVPYSEY